MRLPYFRDCSLYRGRDQQQIYGEELRAESEIHGIIVVIYC